MCSNIIIIIAASGLKDEEPQEVPGNKSLVIADLTSDDERIICDMETELKKALKGMYSYDVFTPFMDG